MTIHFTGERFVPGAGCVIEAEHLHRYFLARTIAQGLDVLDVASGEGYGSHLLAGLARSVVGVDIAASAVEHAREIYKTPNLRFLLGSCAELPLESASVDMVVSFETIEHHDQHEAMLREIRRVLRPGGVLLISSPNRPEYDKTLSEPNPYHIKELDLAEFADLLKSHFTKTAMYAQRVVSGSVVVPYGHDEAGFATISASASEEPVPGLERPIYFVAVASDGELPTLATSIYESRSDAGSKSEAAFLEARLYLSERVGGVAQPYGEARGAALVYALDGAAKTIDLAFPSNLQPLVRLRLDIANAQAAIMLHRLSLHQTNGEEVWRWDGGCDVFVNPGGVVCLPGEAGATLLCLNSDPQFDLAIPPAVLALVRGGAVLSLELTAKPLPDELPAVLARLQTTAKLLPATTATQFPVAGLAGYLEDLADQLKTQITRKNATIAAQHAELEAMRARQQLLYEQVVRAEAQLDLLKEFALPEAASRLERL